MNDEQKRDDRVDAILKQVMGDEPRPELSPFFASRVTNTVKAQSRGRQSHSLMNVYWFLLLAGTIQLTVGLLVGTRAEAILFILVPFGFAIALYWESLLNLASGTMTMLFGSRS